MNKRPPNPPVIQVERGCDAARLGMGCGCIGTCHDMIEVVLAADYFRVLGRLEELEKLFTPVIERLTHPQVSVSEPLSSSESSEDASSTRHRTEQP